MLTFLSLTIAGIVAGSIYALTASGLVVTYTTSGVFNFAQGAIGMLAAFVYWTLTVDWHWPVPLGVAAVLLILAPAAGWCIEKALIRPLKGMATDATLQATVALLLLCVGIAAVTWNQTVARSIPEFFGDRQVTLFQVVITWHEITIVVVTIVASVLLRLFLFHTRTGNAMRAVVDDAGLASLAGASPARFGGLGWMIGAMFAALAGILLAPLNSSLDITTLTFLIVNGYAAAMVGRLRSLPLTLAGGLALGLVENYLVGYLPVGGVLSSLLPIVPMIFLVIVLLALPQNRLRTARLVNLRSKPIPSPRKSLGAAVIVIALAVLLAPELSPTALFTAGHGVAIAIIMLSLVLLVGFGGQVSLCQLTMAGIGAVVAGKIDSGQSWLGLLAAVGVSAAVGAVICLPALRLRGLYLALATLAFAQGMDSAFFNNVNIFGSGGAIFVGRPHIPGLPDQSNSGNFVELVVVFAVLGVALLALRRSPFGRRLAAMGDSEAGSAMLGISLTRTKLIVFVLSSGLAGLGGALYAGQQGYVSSADFALLGSLALLLLATVWGIRTVTGTLFAGLTMAIFPLIQQHVPALADLAYLGIGLAGLGLARNPAGVFGAPSHLPRLSRARPRGTPGGGPGPVLAAVTEGVDADA